ncbi:MAG: BREX system P-loop protein BrxC [Clostridia bacterium]|nr:BREX system P-loop protein BrxC [Clostridia bacterium]
MIIRNMFEKQIDRPINGVIKVDEEVEKVIEQEVGEYVITNELKKHFISFFSFYVEALNVPTADIGVWISGFFGSGKSHFLKMLSYIMENKEIGGVRTVELFREKFSDDLGTFMLIDQATKPETETILFNIGIQSSINKDDTAVQRVFAKVFYEHLGLYGRNLKVAQLEYYILRQGKYDEFKAAYLRRSGKTWEDDRQGFAFKGKYIVPTLMEVLDMSEEHANAWFKDKAPVEFSIELLVSQIKEYVDSKSKNFHLLFMADEVGQYVGTNISLLLDLQGVIEKLGSECKGKVWVVCTGQSALDEIIKVRSDEFSRIQDRFKTRLSLSSSSVDEVIQRRLLKKTPEAEALLEQEYDQNAAVLRNLFAFTTNIVAIKRDYLGGHEFAANYPFIPYQFILLQRVFTEIRRHGNSGKNSSDSARPMLAGFQEAVTMISTQDAGGSILDKDEYTIVPFYRFYDTVHRSLDPAIRNVIEKAIRDAEQGFGIQKDDVNVLKLLYLLRYIQEYMPATLDNLTILMADDIRMDKLSRKAEIQASLDRLMSQNYIARHADQYNFLTDEEQDIQREITNTPVDTAKISERIGSIIYGGIYTNKKFHFGKSDFPFDQLVDGHAVGVLTGGMRLRILTDATPDEMKGEFRLMTESKGKEVVVVLAETDYFKALESAMKIRQYVKGQNLTQKPKSVQDIIRDQQEEATRLEERAEQQIRQALEEGTFYADGEKMDLHGGDAKSRIDKALEYLVTHVYSELNKVTRFADSDADVVAVLNGTANDGLAYGMQHNQEAADAIYERLVIQDKKKMPTSMADIQKWFGDIPYGWREIDIAAVVAKLIFDQRVTIKYAGATIQPDNPKLPDLLRKKTETGKTSISKRRIVEKEQLNKARLFLQDYFDVMSVPDDEDGLVHFIVEKFNEQKKHYDELDARYLGHKYPDHLVLSKALSLTNDVLGQQKDNAALISRVLEREGDLEDSKDDMGRVEAFFATQVDTFDKAARFLEDIKNDLEYVDVDESAHKALCEIRLILMIPQQGPYKYNRIPELNTHMATITVVHDQLLAAKREDLQARVTAGMAAVHDLIGINPTDNVLKNYLTKADSYYTGRREKVKELTSLALLDGMVQPMQDYTDDIVEKINSYLHPTPKPPKPPVPNPSPAPQPTKRIKQVYRNYTFPAQRLQSEADIDAYVEAIRVKLKNALNGVDIVDVK